MRIAQIAPLNESISPKTYGGREKVIHYLTEELVEQGHDVTLFASGDSETSARLITHASEALNSDKGVQDTLAHHIAQMQDVIEHADEFDLLHFHTDYLHFPFTSRMNKPKVTTLHGRLDIPDLVYVYHKFKEQPLVSISDSQRTYMPVEVNWLKTVHHGVPADKYEQGDGQGNYALFVGRISPEKRPDRAISIAKEAGMKIKIAARIDQADRTYYEKLIQELLDLPHVEFVGEVSEDEKIQLLKDARALLFPIDWPEPFGTVMIEAMACGTPVIAYKHGAVPELISHGENGFVVEHFDEAVEALNNVDVISREEVRYHFEQRFTSRIMTEKYLEAYGRLTSKKKSYMHMGA